MSEMNALISAVRSIVARVKSVEESRAFYEQGLRLVCLSEQECDAAQIGGLWGLTQGKVRVAQFAQAGEPCGMIELVEWSEGSNEHIRDPGSPRDYGWLSNNVMTSDMERGRAHLAQFGARFVSEPKEYTATRRITESMLDTATGERLTLIQVGDATDEPPFGRAVATFGVSVPDYDAAIRFYRDTLGLTEAFSMNHTGAPFDALMGSPAGTRLRMALLTSDGNWVGKYELLEMTVPDGFAAPCDANPRADGARNGYWMASAYAKDLDAVAANINGSGATIARGPVELDRPCAGLVRAMLVRAPGGELLELIEGKDD
jgi:catechol 2,3-dioxygenase-like lactoylglutathione lyase family enzyme